MPASQTLLFPDPRPLVERLGQDFFRRLATARFLVWRGAGQTLELAISTRPAIGWQVFGPFGSGAVFLRAALVRLLWYALNPALGSTAMPQGWLHGRLGAIAAIEASQSGVDLVLMKLFEGDTDGFVAWIGEQTKPLVKAYDLEMRDADLETMTNFMKAKPRRTLPFAAPDESAAVEDKEQDGIFPFLAEDCRQP